MGRVFEPSHLGPGDLLVGLEGSTHPTKTSAARALEQFKSPRIGFMLPGPVFNMELVTTARRARYYVIRFAYGLILLFLVWQNDPANRFGFGQDPPAHLSIQEMSLIGRAIFWSFMMIQSIA